MLIAGSVLAMVVAVFRGQTQPAAKPVKAHAHERPWLTHEAMQQLVSPGGGPGFVFGALTLGGTPPAAEQRKQIEEFARTNGIEIRFEVAEDELRAIRVGVTFGGCCGYEGADTLGRLLHRSSRYDCCDCASTPNDDWTSASDEGVSIHGHIAVNRIDVRWEPLLTVPELLDRVEAIVGRPRATVRAKAGDRWIDDASDPDLQLPFVFSPQDWDIDRAIHLHVEHGRIVGAAFRLVGADNDELAHLVRKRWGRPRIVDDVWTWKTVERETTFDQNATRFEIHASAPATTTALARAAATPAPRS